MTISSTPDLLDDNPHWQVLPPGFVDYGAAEIFSGQVETVKCFEDNSRVKELVATPGLGRVLVVDGGGSLRCALLGDILADKACSQGWAGIVIYGCVRDVEILRDIPIGIRALASNPRRSTRRNEGQASLEIRIADVTIKPGDYLYADANGMLLAPGSETEM